MALAVRGVEYTVSIKVGTSIANVDRLAAALRRLNTQVNVSRNAFSAAQPIHNLYAQTLTTLSSSLVRLNSLLPRLSATLNNTAQSQQQLSNSTFRLVQSTRILTVQMQRRLAMQAQQTAQQRLSNQATAQGASATHMLSAAIGSMAAILGTARITGFIRDVTLLAGRVENLNTVMLTVGRTASVTDGEMRVMQDRMKDLGITTQVSRIILTRFAQNNLKVADSLRIARIAQDAAVVAGLNSSETAERMMIAVQRLDTRMLRNIGILINLRNEYQKIAIATGRYENSLTAGEKQQIVLNAVMRAGTALSGAYESALQDVYKQWTTLERKIEEAQRTIGENFLPIFRILVSTFDDFLDTVADTENGLASLIAILAGGAAGFGLAASVLAVLAAVVALVGFLGPWTIGILAVSTAVGLLVTGLSALSEMHNIHIKQQQEKIEQHVFEKLRIMELAEQVRKLNDLTSLSIDQQSELKSIKIEVLSLLTQEERQVIELANSWEEFIEILLGFQRVDLDIGLSLADTIEAKTAQLEEAIAQVAEIELAVEQYGSIAGGSRLTRMKKEVADLRMEIENLKIAADQIELRKLNELEDVMENMSRVVNTAAKSLESASLDALSDSAKEIIEQLKILEKVSGKVMTADEVRRQAVLAQRAEEVKLEKTLILIRDKAIRDGSSVADAQEKINEKKAASAQAIDQIRIKEKAQLETLANLDEVRADAAERLTKLSERASFDSGIASFKAGLDADGLGEFADGIIDMLESSRDFNDAYMTTLKLLLENETAFEETQIAMLNGEEVNQEYVDGLRRINIEYENILDADFEGLLGNIAAAAQAMLESLEADEKSLKKHRVAIEELRRENELYAKGLSSDVVSSILEAESATRKYVDGQELLIKALEETKRNIKEEIDQINDPDLTGPEQTAVGERIDQLEKIRDKILEKIKENNVMRVEEEKKTQREQNEAQEEGAKKELEIREKTFKEITDKFKSTQEKIESLQKAEADKEASTLEKLRKNELEFRKRRGDPLADALGTGMDIVSKFKGDIRGAANKDQAGQLFEQFKQEVFDIFGPNTDFWPQEFKDFMNQEAKNLQKDIDTVDKEHKLRMEEIALEKENFKVQKEQYRQMKRIADFLTGHPEATPADANRLAPVLKPEAVPDTRDARQKRRDAETARRNRAHNRFKKHGRVPEPVGPNRNLGGLPFGVGDAMLSASVAGAQSMGRLSEEATKLNKSTGDALGEIVKFADVAAAEMAKRRARDDAARKKITDAINAANMR